MHAKHVRRNPRLGRGGHVIIMLSGACTMRIGRAATRSWRGNWCLEHWPLRKELIDAMLRTSRCIVSENHLDLRRALFRTAFYSADDRALRGTTCPRASGAAGVVARPDTEAPWVLVVRGKAPHDTARPNDEPRRRKVPHSHYYCLDRRLRHQTRLLAL
jgi:hypothetical protein